MTTLSGTPAVAGQGDVRIGVSSWGSLPGFYPSRVKARDKLSWYARFFSIVEVNVSFYRLVPPRTYAQWIEATPEDFLFDVKAFSELTHFRQTPSDESFAHFRATYRPLGESGKLGGVLFQFPPRFANRQQSRDYLRRVADQMEGGRTVVEFRNDSWFTMNTANLTLDLLRALGLSYAIADEPQIPRDTVPPLVAVTDPDLAYVRLHGRNVDGWLRGGGGTRYNYDYSEAELAEWADIALGLALQARQVHVLFNNNARGDGTRNAIRLSELLGIGPADPPALPLAQPLLFDDG